MGKFQVTQAQWKAVANNLPRVKLDLKPNPSKFEGDDHPVERVSWYDAVEFCDRLSRHTNRQYRLPSEAEWEYACRAGTTTPFHFGETITGKLANYNASGKAYASETPEGYRNETTVVGSFSSPNPFGLHDMHGNVREWCADTWHDNYDDAPKDGSAWTSGGNDNRSPLRGGSWFTGPENCRSADRHSDNLRRDGIEDYMGFRVVCGVGRSQ
jgi:formylglycine-generating enzyme required for sulfatase activity